MLDDVVEVPPLAEFGYTESPGARGVSTSPCVGGDGTSTSGEVNVVYLKRSGCLLRKKSRENLFGVVLNDGHECAL